MGVATFEPGGAAAALQDRIATMATGDAYPYRLTTPLRFAVAVGTVAAVFLIDRAFDSLIDEGSLFLLLGTAVIASAWFAGTGPALAATVAGALLGARLLTATDQATHTRLAIFVLQGLILTAILSELRRARLASEMQAQKAEEARQEGEAASRMKDEFLATVSHELRTPLNAVLGWVHLLRSGKLDAETASRGLAAIDRNARLQAQLTANLLDISKALTGRLSVECRPVSLSDIVRQAAAAALPAAHAKGVRIEQDVPDATIAVLGDWSRLRQVVWQLLANAVKFTPREGEIQVAVRSDRNQAQLVVSDSGPGIDPAFLPRVFDRFTQEDGSPTRTAGGLGVGLSLVRELVELHGGEIAAANRRNGHGAEFTVRFPLQPAETLPGKAGQSTGSMDDSAPLDGLRILVLDRDSEGRELVETVLRQRGASVRTTASMDDALETLESWRPDILVRDRVSPDHDGYVVVGKVRSLEADRGGRIPALALTSFSRTDADVDRLLGAAHRDLPKPIDPTTLTAAVARLSGRERRHADR